MIRRTIVGAAVGTVLVGIFVGRDAVSYVRTSYGYLRDSVRNSVPVDFQLDRARQMLKDLAPEVQNNIHLIAKEEVETQRLQSQIAENEQRLGKDKQQMTQLNNAVLGGKQDYQFGGRQYTLQQVKDDLARRFDRYKTNEATLASQKQLLTARQKGLDAARQKLEGMLAAKRQLQVDIENIQARNQMVAAAETTSNYHFDETRLGRLKELLSDLRTRVEVNERLVNAEQYYHDEIPVDKTAPDDIAAQISQYFQSDKPQSAGLATK